MSKQGDWLPKPQEHTPKAEEWEEAFEEMTNFCIGHAADPCDEWSKDGRCRYFEELKSVIRSAISAAVEKEKKKWIRVKEILLETIKEAQEIKEESVKAERARILEMLKRMMYDGSEVNYEEDNKEALYNQCLEDVRRKLNGDQ